MGYPEKHVTRWEAQLRYRAQNRFGIILPFVLLVLTLLLITVSTVTKQGLGSLHQAKLDQYTKQALFAAEAGVQDAISQLVLDQAWAGPIAETQMEIGALYSATVFNNINPGGGTLAATNGAQVPEGYAYILATGRYNSIERRVGVLVSPNSSNAFGIAIGVGGNAQMQGGKTIGGTIKASGDISLRGSSRIEPLEGSGRILAGGDISTQGSARMDEAQDVRARGGIQSQPAIRGALIVQGADTTPSTLPFIADGRTTNSLSPGEEGLILPNPDQSVLLDPANPNLISHLETSVSGALNLNGQIHYFPDGVEFLGGSNITGPGTIVVGNGNQMSFQGSTGNLNANLIALRSPGQFPGGGNPSIRFQGNADINGLVYAHEDIETQGSFTLNGVLIAYRDGGGDLNTQGNTNINLDATVLATVPGLEAWANGFGGIGGPGIGSGSLSVVTWEKM